MADPIWAQAWRDAYAQASNQGMAYNDALAFADAAVHDIRYAPYSAPLTASSTANGDPPWAQAWKDAMAYYQAQGLPYEQAYTKADMYTLPLRTPDGKAPFSVETMLPIVNLQGASPEAIQAFIDNEYDPYYGTKTARNNDASMAQYGFNFRPDGSRILPTDPDYSQAQAAGNSYWTGIAQQQAADSGGGFLETVAPIALSLALGPAGLGLGSGLGLGAIGSGALTGGLVSAITGGNPLQGALLGGLGGGVSDWLGGASSGYADTAFDGGGSFFDGNYMPSDAMAGGVGAGDIFGGAGRDTFGADDWFANYLNEQVGAGNMDWATADQIYANYDPLTNSTNASGIFGDRGSFAGMLGAPAIATGVAQGTSGPVYGGPNTVSGPGMGAGTAGAASMGLFDTLASGAGNLLGNIGSSIMNNPLQWGALAGGALLGSQNGAQQSGTSTTTTVPWAAQQPYLLDLFQKAKLANDATGIGLSPLQQQAITQAGQANPLQAPATETMQQAITGQLRNPMLGTSNPYLQETIDYANADVSRAMLPAINAANRSSGSFGNSGVADYYGKALTDAYSKNATGMRFQDYTNQQQLNESDISRRMSAAMNAPTFAGNTLANAQNMFTLGTQAKTDPFNTLGKYGSLIGGSYGSATNSPIFTNPTAGLLGGALAGSQIYNSLFRQG